MASGLIAGLLSSQSDSPMMFPVTNPSPSVSKPKSTNPSQSSSIPFGISVAPGLIAGSLSSQSAPPVGTGIASQSARVNTPTM